MHGCYTYFRNHSRLSKTRTKNTITKSNFFKKYFQNVSTLKHFMKLLEIVFRENFERAYIEATEQFYNVKAPQQLALEADGEKAGVFGYMKWAEAKFSPNLTLSVFVEGVSSRFCVHHQPSFVHHWSSTTNIDQCISSTSQRQ